MSPTIVPTFVALLVVLAIAASYAILHTARRARSVSVRQNPSLMWLFGGGMAFVVVVWTVRVAGLASYAAIPVSADVATCGFVLLTLALAAAITVRGDRVANIDLKPQRTFAAPRPRRVSQPVAMRLMMRQRNVRRVLYIDDTGLGANTAAIREVFERRPDVEMVAAQHGVMALESARQIRPTVILLDIQRPDMSSELLLRQLSRSFDCGDVPVVVLTASATPEQVDRILAGGAYAHIARPFDAAHFMSILDRILAVRQVA